MTAGENYSCDFIRKAAGVYKLSNRIELGNSKIIPNIQYYTYARQLLGRYRISLLLRTLYYCTYRTPFFSVIFFSLNNPSHLIRSTMFRQECPTSSSGQPARRAPHLLSAQSSGWAKATPAPHGRPRAGINSHNAKQHRRPSTSGKRRWKSMFEADLDTYYCTKIGADVHVFC